MPVLHAAAARRPGVPRPAARARARLLPGRRLRRAAAAGGARDAARTAGSTCTSRCCRPGAARRRCSTRSCTATTSPARRRSGIEAGLDTGPVFGVVTEPIRPRDTAGDLLERLAVSGAGLLVATLDGIADGTLVARPQPADGVSLAPQDHRRRRRGSTGRRRRGTSTGWSAPARPRPGAWTTFRGERLKLGPVRRWRRPPTTSRPGELRRRPIGGCASAPAPSRSTLGDGAAARQAADAGRRLGARRPARSRASALAERRPAGAASARPATAATAASRTRLGAPLTTCCARSTRRTPTPTWCCRAARRTPARPAATPRSPPSSATARCAPRARSTRSSARCVDRPLAGSSPPVLDLLRLGAYQAAAHPRSRRTPRSPRRSTWLGASARPARPGSSTRCCARVAARRLGRLGGPARLAALRRCGRLALRTAHPDWIADAFAAALEAGGDLAETEPRSPPTTSGPQHPSGRLARRRTAPSVGRASPAASPARARRMRCGCPAATRPRCAAVRAASGRGPGRGQPAVRPRAGERAARRPGRSAGSTCAPARAARPRCWPALGAERGATVHGERTASAPGRAGAPRPPTALAASRCIVGDARELAGAGGGYDRVLLDAPCTGLGALRRRPEARWRRGPDDLADRWSRCSASCWPRRCGWSARAGSSATSPARRTRRRRVDEVVARTSSCSTPGRCSPACPDLGDGPTVQLWPHRHGTDAMFFALLAGGDSCDVFG